MVSVREVNKQLKSSGYYYRFWMRKEIRELSKVLDEDETIKQCVNGYYQGGLALLAATDRRLLLIDYKPMYLTLEIIWYDKIGQIDYSHRLLNASICISTPNKELNFTSYNTQHLRQALLYTQVKIAENGKPEDGKEEAKQTNISFRGQRSSEAIAGLASPTNYRSEPEYDVLPAQMSTPQPYSRRPQHLSASSASLKASGNRLPYSRRRYFAPQESEPLA